MKLTNKSAVIIIFASALSPLLLCILLFIFGDVANVAMLATGYVVFGFPLVLIVGWILSNLTKNKKPSLRWLVGSYAAPALLLNLAIAGMAITI